MESVKGADHDDPDLREAWQARPGPGSSPPASTGPSPRSGSTLRRASSSPSACASPPLTVGPVREILSDDNLGIDRIGGYQDEHEGGYKHPNKKTAIFLALPDEDPTFNFLAAIFYQCLFDSIIRRCRTYPANASPHHCTASWTNLANVGRIPNFSTSS